MRYILLYALIGLTIVALAQERKNGFYLTSDCGVNSDFKTTNPLRPNEQLCLVHNPFLGSEVVTRISEINISENVRYFDLDITSKASAQLNEINKDIKDARIVFVISNEVMFVLHLSEMTRIKGLIRISSISNTDEILQIQEKIETYLASAKKSN